MTTKNNQPAKKTPSTNKSRRLEQAIEAARVALDRTTLADQKNRDDFFEVSVWQVRQIVEAAFNLGYASGRP